jgi:hypothetical protein
VRATPLLCLAIAGCAYRGGSFAHGPHAFPGQRTTVGCLDLAIERRAEALAGATGLVTVLSYEFGNRCNDPAMVDLARASVVARTDDGQELELRAYDPRGEIRAMRLDGRRSGKEAIAYPSEARLAEVCVDVATIAHQAPAQWVCLAAPFVGHDLDEPIDRIDREGAS